MISLILVVCPLFICHSWFGLLIACCLFHVATLVINATGVVFGKDLSEEDDIYLLSGEKKSKNIILESGKLSPELASLYTYFGSHVLLIKSICDLSGGCH